MEHYMDIGEIPGQINRYGKRWYFTHYNYDNLSNCNDMIHKLEKIHSNFSYIKIPFVLQVYKNKRSFPQKRYAIYEREVK